MIQIFLYIHNFGVKIFIKRKCTISHHSTQSKLWYSYRLGREHICGLNLEWDYLSEHGDISMQYYIIKALQVLHYVFPKLTVRTT